LNYLDFKDFLFNISSKPLRVLDASIENPKYVPLNLSENNEELKHIDVSSSSKLGNYVDTQIKKQHGIVAFGGYLEFRNIYKRSTYFNNTNPNTERNIHLGIDLWHLANTPIFTPLDATVHSFQNNTNFGDYGPTIILKHLINTIEFYTLYGHLSLVSIENIVVNQVFKQGEHIGTLGNSHVNGDYPPHLHFQIIKDIQDFKGDYPGVCNKKDLAFYANNYPNPNLLLKL
jgi:murein DD-endopeptidase MepM/ murein hydrolase activator NlpD